MKTGYPPEATMWHVAHHGAIQEGVPKQKHASPMTQCYVGRDVHSKRSTLVTEHSEGHVRAEGSTLKLSREELKRLQVLLSTSPPTTQIL